MRQRIGAEVIDQLGRGDDHILHRRILAVEDAQRIGVETPLGLFVEQIHVLLEISDQYAAVLGAFVGLTERINLQLDSVEPEVVPQASAHQDLLGVDVGAGETERLDADLIELTVAPFLRPLMAEHLAHVIEALRMLRRQLVLDQRTHAACRPFGVAASAFRR